jgi:cbb3-type cytochrome oxidase maturation protein
VNQTALGILLLLVCLLMAVGFLVIFVWAIRDRRFRDIYLLKHRMFDRKDKRRPTAQPFSRNP